MYIKFSFFLFITLLLVGSRIIIDVQTYQKRCEKEENVKIGTFM